MGKEGLEEKLTQNLIEDGYGHVKRDTLLIADISDVTKKYAKKMEHLANIRDGSEDKISPALAGDDESHRGGGGEREHHSVV